VKENLRRIPDKGIGYGVLKYLRTDSGLPVHDPWDISFNYLGQVDNVVGKESFFTGVPESSGEPRGAGIRQREILSLNSVVAGGELNLEWGYSSRHLDAATVEQLSQRYVDHLRSLVEHCRSLSKVVYTPSDFKLEHELTCRELDAFLSEPLNGSSRGEQLESIYRLSPLQEGMLFHGLYDAASGAYLPQFCCTFSGLDIAAFKAAWQYVFNRHSVLRSGFYADRFRLPVQCVYKDVPVPVAVLDYRSMSAMARDAIIASMEAAERSRGFDFEKAPLMRIILIRLDDSRYRMIWMWHHLLFDGWSGPVLIEDFLRAYDQLLSGQPLPEQHTDRYEEYIHHIHQRNRPSEEAYWRSYLQGLSGPTLLPFVEKPANVSGSYEQESLLLDADITAGIRDYVQQHHITVNTLVQGVWSYLLYRYTGNTDIVYGVTVSGRPEELHDVEQRVGMFINTLPLRTSIDIRRPVSSWLQQLQQEQINSRQYQYVALNELQNWSGIGGELFDSILVFENYPVSEVLTGYPWKLKATDVTTHDHTNYPLTLAVLDADLLTIILKYNTAALSAVSVTEIAAHFVDALKNILKEDSLIGHSQDAAQPLASGTKALPVDENDLFDFDIE
jgi:non-ribosomal peptide synthase protein (TIGR01720 family)